MDADEDLSTIYPDYPLANVLVCFGIILVLSIDQIAITLWRRLHPNKTVDASAGAQKKMASDEQVVGTERAQSLPLNFGIPALALLQEEIFKDIMTAYIMEFSIAAHSIIIGINLGLLGEDDISSIVALMIALGFHQVRV